MSRVQTFIARTIKTIKSILAIQICCMRLKKWSFEPDLNRRPYPYQGYALPTELSEHIKVFTAGQFRNSGTTLQLRLYSWLLCTITNFLFSLCRLLLLPREYFNLGRINAPPRDATLPGGNGGTDGTRTRVLAVTGLYPNH